MAYESGEFDPGIGNRPVPGATAFFDNCLWLMGAADKEGKIRYTTLSLIDSKGSPLDIEGGHAKPASAWTTQKFDQGLCFSRSALAVCGDSLFFFWNQGSQLPIFKPLLQASVYTTTGDGALQWSSPIQMFDSSGAALKPAALADVSATSFDENTVIVTTSMGDSLYVGTFRNEDFDADNLKWTAHADRTIDAYLPETPDTGYLGKEQIDTTVAAWRVVFVVDEIVYSSSAGTNYQYSGGS